MHRVCPAVIRWKQGNYLPGEMIAVQPWLLGIMVALLVGYVGMRVLFKPLRWVTKAAGRVVLGGLALVGWNLLGQRIGIPVGVNPFTASAVGLLGIPGFVLVLALKVVMVGG